MITKEINRLPHEVIIFTKLHEDWTKTVDFIVMVNFWVCLVFLLLRPYTDTALKFLLKLLQKKLPGLLNPPSCPMTKNMTSPVTDTSIVRKIIIPKIFLHLACGSPPKRGSFSTKIILDSDFFSIVLIFWVLLIVSVSRFNWGRIVR